MKLQGKTAIITGAAKGIGADEGARIVLADMEEPNGYEVAKAIV